MCHKMGNIMVKAASRTVHHAFAKFLDLAYEGQQVLITRRGRPWARLVPLASETTRHVVWPDVAKRARAASGGRQAGAVQALIRMREEQPW